MQTIIGLRCYKKSHDAASMATYDIVLKLLLADKEVSAYELGLKSQIGIGKHLKKVADIVCTHIYEKLIATLREIFISPQMSPKRTLSDLLEGINMCIDFVQ